MKSHFVAVIINLSYSSYPIYLKTTIFFISPTSPQSSYRIRTAIHSCITNKISTSFFICHSHISHNMYTQTVIATTLLFGTTTLAQKITNPGGVLVRTLSMIWSLSRSRLTWLSSSLCLRRALSTIGALPRQSSRLPPSMPRITTSSIISSPAVPSPASRPTSQLFPPPFRRTPVPLLVTLPAPWNQKSPTLHLTVSLQLAFWLRSLRLHRSQPVGAQAIPLTQPPLERRLRHLAPRHPRKRAMERRRTGLWWLQVSWLQVWRVWWQCCKGSVNSDGSEDERACEW